MFGKWFATHYHQTFTKVLSEQSQKQPVHLMADQFWLSVHCRNHFSLAQGRWAFSRIVFWRIRAEIMSKSERKYIKTVNWRKIASTNMHCFGQQTDCSRCSLQCSEKLPKHFSRVFPSTYQQLLRCFFTKLRSLINDSDKWYYKSHNTSMHAIVMVTMCMTVMAHGQARDLKFKF